MVRLKNAKRVAVGGGLVAVVLAVAGVLSGLFSGFGGGGPNASVPGGAIPVVNSPESPTTNSDVEPDDSQRATDAASTPNNGDVVDVLIKERSYYLRSGAAGAPDLVPAELGQLVTLAQSARGNEDGIRVRITLSPSSRPSAEESLVTALIEAGVPRQALLIRDGF